MAPYSGTQAMPLLPRHWISKACSFLAYLPSNILSIICSYLDYQSLIYLSTTNRAFHRSIDPVALSNPYDRMAFIMRAARDFPQHRPSTTNAGNFECYVCYRVRGYRYFARNQRHRAWFDQYGNLVNDYQDHSEHHERNLRRYCYECGIKTGLETPDNVLSLMSGTDVWICLCGQMFDNTISVSPCCYKFRNRRLF